MTGSRKALLGAATLFLALVAFAFIVAPKSCEWGNAAYFWAGVVVLIAVFAMPLVLRAGASMIGRVGLAIGLVALGCGVWLAGFAAANLRIVCALM